jgi:hypothetical protein
MGDPGNWIKLADPGLREAAVVSNRYKLKKPDKGQASYSITLTRALALAFLKIL